MKLTKHFPYALRRSAVELFDLLFLRTCSCRQNALLDKNIQIFASQFWVVLQTADDGLNGSLLCHFAGLNFPATSEFDDR